MFESVHAKLAGYSAAAAFAVSFLTGLLAGVPFLTVALRALIAGVLFGIATVGARAVIERYVPELLALTTSEKEESFQSGAGIDISVGDDTDYQSADVESPDAAKESERRTGSASGSLFDESLIEEVSESPLDEEPDDGSQEHDERGGVTNTSDHGESLPDLDRLGSFEPGLEAERVAGGQEAVAGSGSQGETSDRRASEESDLEGIDTLDDVSGSTSSAERTPGNSEGGDPRMMAEAIRTVLKREGS